MKKFYFLAIAAAVTMFSSCSKTPKVIEEPLANPDYTSVTVEGSGKYGVINSTTKKEVLPQIFDHIDYLDNGYFLTSDSVGFLLFNTNGNALIPAQDKITTGDGYFELSAGNVKGFYFTEEKSTVTGEYEQISLDPAGNVLFLKNGKYGVLNRKGETIIPGEYNQILWDGKNYNVVKNKNDKRPYFNEKTKKYNWNLAEAAALDQTGKRVKKLTAKQAKKVFEAKK